MKRKNRKVRQHTHFVMGSVGFVALVVTGFIMLGLYALLNIRCSAIAQEIGQCEKQLVLLGQEAVREAARWNRLTTPDMLTEKLVRFGLEMNVTRADQVVRMNRDGRPQPGQIAVARAKARASLGDMAQVDLTNQKHRRVAGAR